MPAHLDADRPEQRIVEAAVHLLPRGAITGWAALRVWGAAYFDGRLGSQQLPVTLALGSSSGRRAKPGIELLYEDLPRDDVVERYGLRITTPRRALFDEVRRPRLGTEATVAADMALASKVLSWPEIDEFVVEHSNFRRSHLAFQALALADAGSRSPAESRLRLFCRLRLGMGALQSNRPVFTRSGDLVCIPDLLDVLAGLALEYNGAEHRTADRQHRDELRAEACRVVGLEYCVVTSRDLRDLRALSRRILAARERAFAARSTATWTTTPPPGWRMPW